MMSKTKRKRIYQMLVILISVMNYMVVCCATEGELQEQVLSPLYTVINIFIAVIQVIGIMQVVKFFPDLVNGLKEQDFTTGSHGAKGVIGGVMLFLIRPFLKLIGVDWV